MGTPTESIWPGVSSLKDYKTTFPNWHAIPLKKVIPTADLLALDLISKMLVYDPTQRLSAKAALLHPYFKDAMRFGPEKEGVKGG